MEIAFILVFFLAVLIWGFFGKTQERTRAENVFYATALGIGLTVLLLKALDLWDFNPTLALTELFAGLNLLP
ncbi:MAG: hypothetical protein ACOYJC_10785 [Christensenellales bacterium]|jgi:hypothetical protein